METLAQELEGDNGEVIVPQQETGQVAHHQLTREGGRGGGKESERL